jgi:hypothetical protein
MEFSEATAHKLIDSLQQMAASGYDDDERVFEMWPIFDEERTFDGDPIFDEDPNGLITESVDVFGSSAAPAYNDAFATSACSATSSPSYDDDRLDAFEIFILDHEQPDDKQTGQPRFDTASCTESDSEENRRSLLVVNHFLNPAITQALVAVASGAPMDTVSSTGSQLQGSTKPSSARCASISTGDTHESPTSMSGLHTHDPRSVQLPSLRGIVEIAQTNGGPNACSPVDNSRSCISSEFKHSSIPASNQKVFKLSSDVLTKRDVWNDTFDHIFTELGQSQCLEAVGLPCHPRHRLPDFSQLEFTDAVFAAQEVFEELPLSSSAAWVSVGKLLASLCWKIPWPPPHMHVGLGCGSEVLHSIPWPSPSIASTIEERIFIVSEDGKVDDVVDRPMDEQVTAAVFVLGMNARKNMEAFAAHQNSEYDSGLNNKDQKISFEDEIYEDGQAERATPHQELCGLLTNPSDREFVERITRSSEVEHFPQAESKSKMNSMSVEASEHVTLTQIEGKQVQQAEVTQKWDSLPICSKDNADEELAREGTTQAGLQHECDSVPIASRGHDCLTSYARPDDEAAEMKQTSHHGCGGNTIVIMSIQRDSAQSEVLRVLSRIISFLFALWLSPNQYAAHSSHRNLMACMALIHLRYPHKQPWPPPMQLVIPGLFFYCYTTWVLWIKSLVGAGHIPPKPPWLAVDPGNRFKVVCSCNTATNLDAASIQLSAIMYEVRQQLEEHGCLPSNCYSEVRIMGSEGDQEPSEIWTGYTDFPDILDVLIAESSMDEACDPTIVSRIQKIRNGHIMLYGTKHEVAWGQATFRRGR